MTIFPRMGVLGWMVRARATRNGTGSSSPHTSTTRSGGSVTRHVLNELGFIWERLQPTRNLLAEGMITYRTTHGNVLVPAASVVSPAEEWPIATWFRAVGLIAS
eukprot:CAMPEP_0172545864 /NCGR_PEP_ID=MMETSP1067-20121228/15723_1 /TAXON_ID=265564 ORGANISM="Thalassiosira punctigera, Strain Tpunct2005C2" /NCGR_SAMPLE_ID=MMETSP1067 /ASSEMBLY_ACC=CAM_ASM_000444 /LENGTH=103 /DNA_ID=CAMNT_0013332695 /DNA_START=2 /DNA_END=309 /DNA_ORIENTATION=+